jgi:hypothetical protein
MAYVLEGVTADDIVGGVSKLGGDIALLSTDGGFSAWANVDVGIREDRVTEGIETLTFVLLRNTLISHNTNSSVSVAIQDLSQYPTLSVTANRSSVDENGVVQFNIVTTDVPASSKFEYTITPMADVNSHVSVGTYTTTKGIFAVNSAGRANVVVYMKEDYITEGAEFLTITIPANLAANTDGTSATVLINDTTQAPNLVLSYDVNPVNEGSNVRITFTGTNIPGGTPISWSLTAGSSDMTPTSGTVIMDLNPSFPTTSNSILLSAIADSTTEGNETYTVTTGAVSGINLTAKSLSGTIKDTSVSPPTPPPPAPPATPVPPPVGTVLTDFFNCDLEITTPASSSSGVYSFPGWKVYMPGEGTVPSHLRLNGFSTILGYPTPQDPTPAPFSSSTPYGDQDAPTSASFGYEFVDDSLPEFGGIKAIRLYSSCFGVPFNIIRGPYLVSDYSCNLVADSVVSFHWKAQSGSDDYDVFAYLVEVNTGASILLLDDIGSSSPWQLVTRKITAGEAGTYKFVFVCGTYDASGGTASGASLYLDNICVDSELPLSSFVNTSSRYLSSSTLTVGTGTKNLVVGTGLNWTAGQVIKLYNGNNSMTGTIVSYNPSTGALVVAVDSSVGSGTYGNWGVINKGGATTPPAVPPPPPASAPAAPTAIVLDGFSSTLISQIYSPGPGYKIFDIDFGDKTGDFTLTLDFLNNYDWAELDWNGNKVNTGFNKGIQTITINKATSSPSSIRLTINPNNITGWETQTGNFTAGEVNPGGWWQGSGVTAVGATVPSSGTVSPPTTIPPPYTTKPDGTVYCPTSYVGRKLKGTSTVNSNNEADVTGSLSGDAVWGNNSQGYSDDSDLSRAVVHAGLASVGELIKVRITAKDFVAPITGSTVNGVTSQSLTNGWCGITMTRLTPLPTPTYAITPQLVSVNEGFILIFDVNTTLVPDATTLCYGISGNTNALDYVHVPYFDSYTDVRSAYINSVQSGSTWGSWPGSRAQPTPNAILFANYHYATVGIGEGRLSPSTLNTDYLVPKKTVPISSNRTSVTLYITADQLTEGPETLRMTLSNCATSTQLVQSPIITINDTSTTPALTWSLTPNVSYQDEGNNIQLNINANNLQPSHYGTSGRWVRIRVGGTNITTGDIQGGNVSNSVKFTSNIFPYSFVWGFVADLVTEGVEVARFDLFTWLDGAAEELTTPVACCYVTIGDTSTAPAPPPPPPGTPLPVNPSITSFGWNIVNDSTYLATQTQLAGLIWRTDPDPGDITHAEIRVYRGSTYQTSGSAQVIRNTLGNFPASGSYRIYEFTPGDGVAVGLGSNINDGEVLSYRLIFTRSNGTTFSPTFDLQWHVGNQQDTSGA